MKDDVRDSLTMLESDDVGVGALFDGDTVMVVLILRDVLRDGLLTDIVMSFEALRDVENVKDRENSGVIVFADGDAVNVCSFEKDWVGEGVAVSISEADLVSEARVLDVDNDKEMLEVVVMVDVGDGVPRVKLFVNVSSGVRLSECVLVFWNRERLGNDTV